VFKNGDLARVNIPGSSINGLLAKVIGIHTKLPVVNSVYIVLLMDDHNEEWDAFTVPEGHLIKVEN